MDYPSTPLTLHSRPVRSTHFCRTSMRAAHISHATAPPSPLCNELPTEPASTASRAPFRPFRPVPFVPPGHRRNGSRRRPPSRALFQFYRVVTVKLDR